MNSRISKINSKIVAHKAIRNKLRKDVRELRKENSASKKLVVDLKNSSLLLEYVIEKNYDTVVELFEDTISAGLQELFNEEYAFMLAIDRSGDHMNCEFQVTTDNCNYYQNLRMNYGKSLQEIVACVMRIIICYLDKRMPNVVILDEPLGGSREFRQDIAHEFFNKIAREFGMQIIIVTQNQSSIADNVIDLSKKPTALIC
jgi:hypothetical protein